MSIPDEQIQKVMKLLNMTGYSMKMIKLFFSESRVSMAWRGGIL